MPHPLSGEPRDSAATFPPETLRTWGSPPCPPGPPMTLGNTRSLGVRSLVVTCELCHHEAVLAADQWSDAVLVRDFRPRMVCTRCGSPLFPQVAFNHQAINVFAASGVSCAIVVTNYLAGRFLLDLIYPSGPGGRMGELRGGYVPNRRVLTSAARPQLPDQPEQQPARKHPANSCEQLQTCTCMREIGRRRP